MRAYWGRALRSAARNVLPKRPREIAVDLVGWLLAIVILRWVVGAESPQVTDEVRWGLSVVGAFLILMVGSFFVQLVAALPRLEVEAVQAGITADRISRVDASVRALDRRIMEGVHLREALDHRPTVEVVGPGWAQRLALWQRQCRRTVRHCAPLRFVEFQATVGSDVLMRGHVPATWTPRGDTEQQARRVIQEWLHALGEVRDALTQ